jgi:hypothetical protein
MNRTYARSLASLASLVVSLTFGANAAIELWLLRNSTIPSLDALQPLAAKQTWRFVQPMIREGADAEFVESRINGLVDDSVLRLNGWKSFVKARASRLWWELAAWSFILVCSAVSYLTRRDSKNVV